MAAFRMINDCVTIYIYKIRLPTYYLLTECKGHMYYVTFIQNYDTHHVKQLLTRSNDR